MQYSDSSVISVNKYHLYCVVESRLDMVSPICIHRSELKIEVRLLFLPQNWFCWQFCAISIFTECFRFFPPLLYNVIATVEWMKTTSNCRNSDFSTPFPCSSTSKPHTYTLMSRARVLLHWPRPHSMHT